MTSHTHTHLHTCCMVMNVCVCAGASLRRTGHKYMYLDVCVHGGHVLQLSNMRMIESGSDVPFIPHQLLT